MKYFRSFLPDLAKKNEKFELFYEVKANLKKKQVKQLKDSGITTIQPGIESFSNQVLELMRKGVKGLQNVQLLKWCKEFGVRAEWNFLYGFPNEALEEYEKMIDIIQCITHLTPPGGVGKIRMDRFSPNFERSTSLGFCNIRPFSSYSYVYPLDHEALSDFAYYFAFDYKDPLSLDRYVPRILDVIQNWTNNHEASDLFILNKDDQAIVCDFRPNSDTPFSVVSGLELHCLQCCDEISTVPKILTEAKNKGIPNASLETISQIINKLCDRKLLLTEDNYCLTLAINADDGYEPSAKSLEKLINIASKSGYTDSNGDIVVKTNCAAAAVA
jgi:ribosomal peptide maturation radical SAM protein 1